jgi:hypothetical protein
VKFKNVDVLIFEGLQHSILVDRSQNAWKLTIGFMVFGVFSYDYLLQYSSVVIVSIVLIVLLATLFKAAPV